MDGEQAVRHPAQEGALLPEVGLPVEVGGGAEGVRAQGQGGKPEALLRLVVRDDPLPPLRHLVQPLRHVGEEGGEEDADEEEVGPPGEPGREGCHGGGSPQGLVLGEVGCKLVRATLGPVLVIRVFLFDCLLRVGGGEGRGKGLQFLKWPAKQLIVLPVIIRGKLTTVETILG